MRASHHLASSLGASARQVVVAATCACAALAAVNAAAEPAWASSSPKYTLAVTEGETTLPEYPVLSTVGEVEHAGSGSVAVSIARGGVVVAKGTGDRGSAWMSQVPQVGDVVSLESPVGTTIGVMVYDGLPAIAPTVCAGSTDFSGQNSPGETVRGGYFTETQNPYREEEQTGRGRAQVTILSGTSFGGGFLSPLAFGQTVYAEESLETPLAGGAVFEYSSLNERPVGACPPPPLPPPPPPPPPPALQGSLLRLGKIDIRKLLKSGWLTYVTINQPGTVTEDLYLRDGTLPAYASSAPTGKHRHRRKPPALLIARGTADAKSAGTVHVVIHVTARGRKVLRHARHLEAVLVTTLRSKSGAKLSLPRHPVSLHT
jgi:hypothetical protein